MRSVFWINWLYGQFHKTIYNRLFEGKAYDYFFTVCKRWFGSSYCVLLCIYGKRTDELLFYIYKMQNLDRANDFVDFYIDDMLYGYYLYEKYKLEWNN